MSSHNKIENYDIDSLVTFLNSKANINRISLQFGKELQNEFQIELYKLLQSKVNTNKLIYIIGDTSYGQCCCDEVTAMHLDSDIIVRVGSSCFTRNSKTPIYFLYSNLPFTPEEVSMTKEKINEIISRVGENVILLYNEQTKKNLIDVIRNDIQCTIGDINNDSLESIPESKLLYGRGLKGKEITNETTIIYIGRESDIVINELSVRYINKIKSIEVIDMYQFTIEKISQTSVNPFLYRRFNLIEKAKQSNVFGILIGSLSLPNLNSVIADIKYTLSSKDKKCYTFLLGKITEEKLANFVEYIDCFILIACPFNEGYSKKSFMRPIVSPLDIKMAFDENFKWNAEYSLDVNYLSINKEIKEKDKERKLIKEMEEKCQSLQIKDINEALVPVFSETTLVNYDKRKFKGLDDQPKEEEPKKIIKGKRGIPIKYENID